MREIRTLIDAELRQNEELELDPRAAAHVVRVLRRKIGDRIVVFDGHGTEAEAELIAIERRGPCRVRIGTPRTIDRESPLKLELIQAIARGEKMDWVIQKATELGVAAIRPVFTERSEVHPKGQALLRKQQRWREIANAACEQSGRNTLPILHAPVALCQVVTAANVRLMLDLDGATRLARAVSAQPAGVDSNTVALAIGPEGGFGDQDRLLLHNSGFVAVTLGPRVLRTETAGLAAISVLQWLCGDFDTGCGAD